MFGNIRSIMPAPNERFGIRRSVRFADSSVEIWKFIARRNLSEPRFERQAAGDIK